MLLPILLSSLDVSALPLLGTTREEEHYRRAQECEIDAVAGSIVNSQLVDPAADASAITKIAEPEAVDSGEDSRLGSPVSEALDPLLEGPLPVPRDIDADLTLLSFHPQIVA